MTSIPIWETESHGAQPPAGSNAMMRLPRQVYLHWLGIRKPITFQGLQGVPHKALDPVRK